MKSISTFSILLVLLFFSSKSISQSNFQYAVFKKNHPLKAEDLKSVQKDGKIIWTVKTSLLNKSKDTLYYFGSTCSSALFYSTDTMALAVSSKTCDNEQTVIAVPPRGQKTVDLEIIPQYEIKLPMTFRIVMFLYKAKNLNERIPYDTLIRQRDRSFLIFSNKIKT